jgi:hypothetical protein
MPLAQADQIRIQKAIRYRRQAESLRAMADVAPTEPIAEQLLAIAAQYDRLADKLNAALKR